MAANSAIINYNDGFHRMKDVLIELGLQVSQNFLDNSIRKDKQIVLQSLIKSLEKGKKRRKSLRAVRKGFIDREREEEGGESYSKGAF
ncbi:MAG: hypothetical protein GY817_00525 [bacterium]|nr:hypothetical protein [bacterium]